MNLQLIKYNEHMVKIESTFRHDYCFLIQLDDKMIGTIWFEEITDTDAKPKMFIMEPECWMKGIYKETTSLLIDIAFVDMKLQKLYVDVNQTSLGAYRGYKECGFVITKREPGSSDLDCFNQGALELTLFNKLYSA